MSIRCTVSWAMVVLSVCLIAGLPVALVGQDEPEPQGKDSAVSGRLPPYYGEVVTETQRKEIYTIQSSFMERLKSLEAQYKDLQDELKKVRASIDGIKSQEREAIEKVLTREQLAQVKRKQAEAQARLAQELLRAAEEAAKRAEALAQPE